MEQNACEGMKACILGEKSRIIIMIIICEHFMYVLFSLKLRHICYFSLCFVKIIVSLLGTK
jgi:hypothetical protein